MTILVIYTTNSGSTEAASRLIAETLAQAGSSVVTKHVSTVTPEDFTGKDLILLGSPSWDYETNVGQPLEDMTTFLKGATVLSGKKVAIFGLGDTSYTKFCGTVDVMEMMVKEKGATVVGPLLRVDKFFSNSAAHDQVTSWARSLLSADERT